MAISLCAHLLLMQYVYGHIIHAFVIEHEHPENQWCPLNENRVFCLLSIGIGKFLLLSMASLDHHSSASEMRTFCRCVANTTLVNRGCVCERAYTLVSAYRSSQQRVHTANERMNERVEKKVGRFTVGRENYAIITRFASKMDCFSHKLVIY